MIVKPTRRAGIVLGFLCCVAIFASAVGIAAYKDGLDKLARSGRSDLALAADSLEREMARYRSLAVVVADHPGVIDVLRRDQISAEPADFLLSIADKTGSLDVMVVDRTGQTLAMASRDGVAAHRGTPYFERAMDGATGLYHTNSAVYGHRAFIFAAPVFADEGPVVGAVVIVANIEMVESEWRGGRPALFFSDDLGVVFVSNRSELVLRSRSGDIRTAVQSGAYGVGDVSPFRAYQASQQFGHDIWQLQGARYLPQMALHLTLDVPVVGLMGEILLDLGAVRQVALLQFSVAAAMCLAFGALLFWALERRRRLADANVQLETQVSERTAELTARNTDLQRAQADLVQAGKLSALGQMSAGISHELNQPLMAIQSFADNAEAFLAKGDSQTTASNLSRISDLAQRMARIIRNLRAFARQEEAVIQDVEMVNVIESAVEMAGPRLRETDVNLHWTRPDRQIWVRGGDVRLQQVVLNLVTNAADAMSDTATRDLTIALSQNGARVRLTVRDTGPGLADAERVFEPFYSTKQVSSAEGMGLGLSISYGLVQSFGGDIKGRNHADGGAEFTVELDAVAQKVAA